MKRDAFDKMMMVELAIMLVLFALIIIFSGCSGLHKVAPPLQGGKADLVVSGKSPGIKVSQPENSQAPTLAEYSREMIPVLVLRTNLLTESSNVFAPSIFDNTNWVVVRETYKTSIGEHQKDVAREGWVGVQKAAAVISKMQPVMYAGIILIIAAIVMSYFQARYPSRFTPGLKVIALTFCAGLALTVLPALTQDRTILIGSLFAVLAIVLAFIFSRQFDK